MPYPQRPKLFCDDLPTQPLPNRGLILVTGASGYIGGRLVPELIERGYAVRVMVRSFNRSYGERWPSADVVVGDALNKEDIQRAMEGVTVAYYLMHSLLQGPRKFRELEIQVACNFRCAAHEKHVERIIYLGGLGDTNDHLSTHLRSRLDVARELAKGPVPVTILRAAVIIGSGSASFEIIRNLVGKMPVVFLPACAKTLCQPISIRDVVKYMVGCLETEESKGKEYDIGGHEIMSYENMLKVVAGVLGKKRIFPKLPVNQSVFAFLAGFITPVPAPITRSLMAGLANEVVCRNSDIRNLISFETVPFREAVQRALKMEFDDEIKSRWSDAYPPTCDLVPRLHELKALPKYMSSHGTVTEKEAVSLFYSICRIGGREGWFNNNWMWRLRGQMDRLLQGVGMARGRRSQSELRENDVIDFFRVEELEKPCRLLLRAEMKLPGLAWLEFTVKPFEDGKKHLTVSAYFEPRGTAGKLYWYFFLPFHYLIFTRLIKAIERRSRGVERI